MKSIRAMRAAPQARRMHWLFVACVSFALSACGGGGGGGSSTPPPTSPGTTNNAPTANAGADQTIQLPTDNVALTGSGQDADGNTLTYSWSATPAGVTFNDASAASTTARFPGEGTYTLTLTVNDGTASASDTLQVVVQPAAAPGNAPPSVDAGADQTIELPTSDVQLQPTVSDDGAPTPAALTYSWSVTSGSGVTFDDASAASTAAHFTTAGAHTLQLTVSDGSLSTTDTLQVVVNPAVYPGADWVDATPAEMNMDQALLEQARDYSMIASGSGFIARKGRRVFVWGDQSARYSVKSATKAIGGITLGLALDDGRLTLSSLAKQHLASFGAVPPEATSADPRMDTITVLQLAVHTAGFPKPGDEQPLVNDPGTTWLYSDGGLNWLADTLTAVFVEDLNTVLSSRVLGPLGIVSGTDLRWRDNAFRSTSLTIGGTPVARRELASGIAIDVDAMARIGHLFLRRGVWNDQRLLSESFIDTVRAPRPEIAGTPIAEPATFPNAPTKYGLLWWTNATGELPNVPQDAYWAWGLGDSLIVVIPSLDLVIARTGNNPDDPALTKWRTGWDGTYTVLEPFLTPIAQSADPLP